MPRRFLFGFLVLVAVLVGGGLLAATAYQAGLATAAAGTAPAHVPYWGALGWHPFGVGLFGLLGFLLFLFLVFAAFRAIFGPRGHWDHAAPYPDGGSGPSPWERRARDSFEAWHREAHAARDTASGREEPPSSRA
jgi:hypothetical protein